MAIHPYPTRLESEWTTADGVRLDVRPVRPEDAELEREFVASLSEQTRYFRFFYRLHQLTPAMLARFTQVDYDRELAMLALAPDPASPTGEKIVGISRYIANYDGESAEFAVVVTDAWQGRGIGRMLMERIIACAKAAGPEAPRGRRAARQSRDDRSSRKQLGFDVARRCRGAGAGPRRPAAGLSRPAARPKPAGQLPRHRWNTIDSVLC